jgi:hypothetical protein
MRFLEWLQFTPVGSWVAETLWAYPFLETLHTLGMALLIGSLGLINLRILGYKPNLPILGTLDLLPLAWLGFIVNAISGTLLFTSDAVLFYSSYTFRIKMFLILLAGINAFVLSRKVFRDVRLTGSDVVPSQGIRWIARSSLLFWVGAIIAGRLIAYTP